MYIKTNQLPQVVQHQLKTRGYNSHDIGVVAREKYSLHGGGGDGMRDYTDVIDLVSGAIDANTGSWGGANIFNPSNKVDLDDTQHDLPVTSMVIKGHEGYKPYATVYMHPSIIGNFAGEKADVTAEEKEVLEVFASYKPAYRQEYLRGKKFNVAATIESLITKKLVKRNAAGALSLTTEGRNAVR